jgi:hypothetical protein
MIRRTLPFALAVLAGGALTAHVAWAQVPANAPDPQAMVKAMEDARAAASRPGDENLTCEQLQEEFIAAAMDPALQAKVQAAGAQAEKDMAAMENAQAEIAAQTATTVAGSVVPGASMGAMAATAANAEAAKARGTERLQSRMAQAANMTAALPALMRGERLMQLAVAKKCEWAEGIDPGAMTTKSTE